MPFSLVVAHKEGKIEIGRGTYVSMFSRIAAIHYVKIGQNVLMGPNVFIADYNHEYRNIEKPIMYSGNIIKHRVNGNDPLIEIGDDSWLGTNVVIVGTVKIGKHCVIGANSLVNSDIPDFSVAVGCPCKVIKRIEKNKRFK